MPAARSSQSQGLAGQGQPSPQPAGQRSPDACDKLQLSSQQLVEGSASSDDAEHSNRRLVREATQSGHPGRYTAREVPSTEDFLVDPALRGHGGEDPAGYDLIQANFGIAIRCLYDVDGEAMRLGPVNMIPPGMNELVEPIIEECNAKKPELTLLLPRSVKDCARNSITRTKTRWTSELMLDTCKGCFDKQRICLRWLESHDTFIVLPIPAAVREDDSQPDKLSWYQTSQRQRSKRSGLWT